MIATLTQKPILDFGIDAMEPLLSALCSFLVQGDLSLELGNSIFRRAQLMRKLLRRIDCMSAVLLGDIGSFAQKLKNSLTGFVEVTVVASFASPDRTNGMTSGLIVDAFPCHASARPLRRRCMDHFRATFIKVRPGRHPIPRCHAARTKGPSLRQQPVEARRALTAPGPFLWRSILQPKFR